MAENKDKKVLNPELITLSFSNYKNQLFRNHDSQNS